MSQQIELTAELRQDVGKGASRRLRRQGDKVPGIIYGADSDAQSLTLQSNQLANNTRLLENLQVIPLVFLL